MTKREKLVEALKETDFRPDVCWEAYCEAFAERNPFLVAWREKGEKEGWLEPIKPPKSYLGRNNPSVKET